MMMKIQKIYRVIFIALALTMIMSLNAFAVDFVIEKGVRVPIPNAYTFDRSIEVKGNFTALSNPSDLFVDQSGNIFVADSDNNRIIKFNKDGNTLREYLNPDNKGFNDPEGVFVGSDGDIYVADTGNYRIVHITADDKFVEQFIKPVSKLIGADFQFQPSKIGITATNLIYVLNKTSFQGFFTIDSENNFRGYANNTQVGYNAFDEMLRIFGSDFQRQMVAKRLPPPASNFCVKGNNVYASITTKGGVSGQIAEYTSVGKNLMGGFDYGLSSDEFGDPSISALVDLDVNSNDIISVLDQKNGKVLQYSRSGDLLCVFGNKGDNRGEFQLPVSISYGPNGCIYVLDKAKGNIQVFNPTAFIESVQSAVKYYDNGKYEEAKQKWMKVLEIDESYSQARKGIAQSEYKAGKLNEALADFKSIEDVSGYSKVYSEIRHNFYRTYFPFIVFGVIVLVLLIGFIIKRLQIATKKHFNF